MGGEEFGYVTGTALSLKTTKMSTGTTRPCCSRSTARRYGVNTDAVYIVLLDVEKAWCDAVVMGRQIDVVRRA